MPPSVVTVRVDVRPDYLSSVHDAVLLDVCYRPQYGDTRSLSDPSQGSRFLGLLLPQHSAVCPFRGDQAKTRPDSALAVPEAIRE